VWHAYVDPSSQFLHELFFIPNFSLCDTHKHTHTHNNLILFHIHYAFMFFNYHLKMNNFGWNTSSNSIIFKAKNMLKLKTPKCVVNMNFTNFNSYCSFNHQFENERCTFDMKKEQLKFKKDCPQANIECLKHAKNFWNTIKFWSFKVFN
jgi:hypothetical protein